MQIVPTALLPLLVIKVAYLYLASLVIRRQRAFATTVIVATVIGGIALAFSMFSFANPGVTRWANLKYLFWCSHGLLVTAAFLNRPPLDSNHRFQLRLKHVALITLYAGIFLGFCQYVNWTDLGVRYESSIRYLQRAFPILAINGAAIIASIWYRQRCPRAFRAVLGACLISVTSTMIVAYSRVDMRAYRGNSSTFAQVALLLASALLFYGIFAGRGLRKSLPFRAFNQEASGTNSFLATRTWLALAVLFGVTFLPWMHGRATFSSTSVDGHRKVFTTRTTSVSCNGWHTTLRLGPATIPMALVTVGCSGVAAVLARFRGKGDIRGHVSVVASVTGLATLCVFSMLLFVQPYAHVGIGVMIASAALVGQLWPSMSCNGVKDRAAMAASC